MPEQIYYNQDQVRISTTRATFGAKTYAVNGITSLRGIIINPNRTGPVALLIFSILFSFTCGCCGLVPAVAAADVKGDKSGPFAMAGAMFFVAFCFLLPAGLSVWWLIAQKATFAVLICTSAGEHQAYVSTDEREVDDIVHALNKAIIDRG